MMVNLLQLLEIVLTWNIDVLTHNTTIFFYNNSKAKLFSSRLQRRMRRRKNRRKRLCRPKPGRPDL